MLSPLLIGPGWHLLLLSSRSWTGRNETKQSLLFLPDLHNCDLVTMSSPSQAHRPRKKRKSVQTLTRSATITDIVKIDSQDNTVTPEFPLVAFLWPTRGTTSQWVLLPLILMIVGLFRWSVGLWGHSGYQQPPMHGDFEAQRHWMEITTHLPVSKWYFYDLKYWGLDYPPLTAYHSWLCGKM